MVSLVCTLRQHTDEVSCCCFSPTLLVTGSADKSLRFYKAGDFSELSFSPLPAHDYGVHSCCFSPCGGFLLSCSTDGSVKLWRTDSGELCSTLTHPRRSPLRVCSIHPDSCLVLAGACDGTVALWEFSTKKLKRCGAVSEASVVACSFSPCGQMFATGCTQGDLKLWDLDIRLLHSEKDAHDLGVACCSFAPQFQIEECRMKFRLASCGQDSRLKIWIVSRCEGGAGTCTIKLLYTLTGQSAPVLSCAFSSDGETVVSGSVDKSVAIYDAKLGTLLHSLKQHDRYVTTVAVSPTFGLIATGSMDRSVNVWKMGEETNPTAAEPLQTFQGRKLPGHSGPPLSDWTEQDVQTWLGEQKFERLIGVFKSNNIDGTELSRLSRKTLSEMGIESVGLCGSLLRKIEAMKVKEDEREAPDEFLCPITRELMKDPVIAADGYSYERESIESWLQGENKSSPMTNLPLRTTLLTPNRSLKMAITRWTSSQEASSSF